MNKDVYINQMSYSCTLNISCFTG